MARAWLRIGIAAAVFVAAVAIGFAAAARLAPERLRLHLEARLAEDLGRPVRLGALRLGLAPPGGLVLALDRVRVGARGDRLRLRVPEAEVRIDPLPLLAGRLRIGRLELHRPHLHLVEPPAPDAADGPAPTDVAGRLAQAAGTELPFRWLGVRDGRVTLVPRGAAEPRVLRAVEGTLDARRLRVGRSLTLRGVLETPDGAAPLTLAVEARGEAIRVEAQADGLPLQTLARLRPGAVPADARGRIDLRVEWREEDATRRLVVLASGEEVELAAAEGRPEIRLGRPRLRAELLRLRGAWELAFGELVDGALRLRASGRLATPIGPGSRLALRLESDALPLRGPDSLLARTPARWRAPLEAALAPVETARMVGATLALTTRPRRLAELASGAPPRPGEIDLALEVADATVRAGASDRLEDVSGRLAWNGDRLEARDVRARFRGGWLPRLDLVVRGLANVQGTEELRCVEPGPAPALPGLPRLVAWLDAQPRDADGAPSFEGVSLRADWLAHPALVCSLEQLVATVRPAPGGLDVEVERAVFAGLPVEGRGAWRGGEGAAQPASLSLTLAMGPPFEPMTLHPPRSPWAQGRFRAGLRRLGPWRLTGADGAFRLDGASLALDHVALGLDPAGPVRARVAVDLGHADRLPFEGAFALEEHDATEVARSGGIVRPPLSGSLHGAGAVRGHLTPGEPLLRDATGTLVLHARGGRLHRRIPPLLAIATASGSLNPFAAGSELPFDAADLAGVLEGGALRSEHFALVGPTVRMAAQGTISATKPHAVDAVIGLFLFPGLDSLVDRLPLLNRVLLGPDGNLVGAYLAMEGPFGEPRARVIPIRSIATGPASLVFERIPGLLFGGLRALRGALVPPAPPAPSEAADPGRADS